MGHLLGFRSLSLAKLKPQCRHSAAMTTGRKSILFKLLNRCRRCCSTSLGGSSSSLARCDTVIGLFNNKSISLFRNTNGLTSRRWHFYRRSWSMARPARRRDALDGERCSFYFGGDPVSQQSWVSLRTNVLIFPRIPTYDQTLAGITRQVQSCPLTCA